WWRSWRAGSTSPPASSWSCTSSSTTPATITGSPTGCRRAATAITASPCPNSSDRQSCGPVADPLCLLRQAPHGGKAVRASSSKTSKIASSCACRRMGRPRQRPALRLLGVDDAAADGAGAGEEGLELVALAPADGALQRGQVLGEAAEHLEHRLAVV